MKKVFCFLFVACMLMTFSICVFADDSPVSSVADSSSAVSSVDDSSSSVDSSSAVSSVSPDSYSDSVVSSVVEPTVWDKPFNDYTPTEAYLLIIASACVIAMFIYLAKKGVF